MKVQEMQLLHSNDMGNMTYLSSNYVYGSDTSTHGVCD